MSLPTPNWLSLPHPPKLVVILSEAKNPSVTVLATVRVARLSLGFEVWVPHPSALEGWGFQCASIEFAMRTHISLRFAKGGAPKSKIQRAGHPPLDRQFQSILARPGCGITVAHAASKTTKKFFATLRIRRTGWRHGTLNRPSLPAQIVVVAAPPTVCHSERSEESLCHG